MPRHLDPCWPAVVYRTARAGLRLSRGQRRRLVGLLVSAGDVWACVLEVNAWRRARQDAPLAGYPALCRELAAAGPGCFGELDSAGARSVLRRYCDAWFAAAAPERTFRVCPRRDVTRGAALITATSAGPLAGTCPPRRPPRPAGESLALPRGPRKITGELT